MKAGAFAWVAALALLTSGCLRGPSLEPASAPPSPLSVAASADFHPPVPSSRAEQPAGRSALERRARRLAVRLRSSGCGALRTGSAFAVGPNLLVTNRHVVSGAGRIDISTWDGRSATTRVVGLSTASDLALLAVDQPLSVIARLSPGEPPSGDAVLVAGYPHGGRESVAHGHVVGLAQDPGFAAGTRVLQLSADVEPGNSGGPVLGADGSVVGVIYGYELASDHALAIAVPAVEQLLRGEAIAAPTTPCQDSTSG